MILCGNLIISFLVNCVNPFFIVRHEISDRRSKIRERQILVKYSYKRDNRKRNRPPAWALYRAQARLVQLRSGQGEKREDKRTQIYMPASSGSCSAFRGPRRPVRIRAKGSPPPCPPPRVRGGGSKRLRRIETLRYAERNPLTYRHLAPRQGYEDFGKIFSTPSGQP